MALLEPVGLALIVSFRRLTEEREMTRIGLSLDRLERRGVDVDVDVGVGVGVGVGKDPGMVYKLGLKN